MMSSPHGAPVTLAGLQVGPQSVWRNDSSDRALLQFNAIMENCQRLYSNYTHTHGALLRVHAEKHRVTERDSG